RPIKRAVLGLFSSARALRKLHAIWDNSNGLMKSKSPNVLCLLPGSCVKNGSSLKVTPLVDVPSHRFLPGFVLKSPWTEHAPRAEDKRDLNLAGNLCGHVICE